MAATEADRLLRIARRDLRMACRLLDPDVEEASWGWALQQAFEKLLKAWLHHLGANHPTATTSRVCSSCWSRPVWM